MVNFGDTLRAWLSTFINYHLAIITFFSGHLCFLLFKILFLIPRPVGGEISENDIRPGAA
jgi:hypothetical protein